MKKLNSIRLLALVMVSKIEDIAFSQVMFEFPSGGLKEGLYDHQEIPIKKAFILKDIAFKYDEGRGELRWDSFSENPLN